MTRKPLWGNRWGEPDPDTLQHHQRTDTMNTSTRRTDWLATAVVATAAWCALCIAWSVYWAGYALFGGGTPWFLLIHVPCVALNAWLIKVNRDTYVAIRRDERGMDR